MQRIKHKIKKTFSSLAIRNYRLYFFGITISTTGTWMQNIGQAWLVLKLTNSGTALGITIALQFLPMLFLGPWGGVLVDRYSKRKILYITQTIAGILALILGILVFTNFVQLWMVYVLAFLLGLISVVDNPARQTFITEMVGEKHLMNAVSVNGIQINLTRVIGPALAAILIATLGMAPLFFINAISYVAVIVALLLMNKDELLTVTPVDKTPGQIKEGFKYMMRSMTISTTLLMLAIIGTFTYEFSVVLPLFSQFTFHGDASSFALLMAGTGIGAVFGSISIAHSKKVNLNTIVKKSLYFAISMLFFAFSPTLYFAILMSVIVGFCSINFLSLSNVLLQIESVPEMRGRVMAIWAVAFLGSTPIGGPIIGFISEHANPRIALLVGSLAAFVASYIGFRALKKHKLN